MKRSTANEGEENSVLIKKKKQIGLRICETAKDEARYREGSLFINSVKPL